MLPAEVYAIWRAHKWGVTLDGSVRDELGRCPLGALPGAVTHTPSLRTTRSIAWLAGLRIPLEAGLNILNASDDERDKRRKMLLELVTGLRHE